MVPAAQNDWKYPSSQACLHVCGERRCGCRISTDLHIIRQETPEVQREDIEQIQTRFEKFLKAIGATNVNSAHNTDAKAAELDRRFKTLRDIAKDRGLAKIRGSAGGDMVKVNMSRCEDFGCMKQCACTVEKPWNLSGWSNISTAAKDDIARAKVSWKNQRPRMRSNRETPGRACSGLFYWRLRD